MELNRVRVCHQSLPNHPFDARGVLSYLRGARGAYGYLCHATVEGDLIKEVLGSLEENILRLRCSVPAEVAARGGCTVYGSDCGRYPIPLTLIIE